MVPLLIAEVRIIFFGKNIKVLWALDQWAITDEKLKYFRDS